MYSILRKAASIILVLMVLFFTTISILAIWDIIEVERILSKTLGTLLVIFVAAAIMLFIFAVIFKTDADRNNSNNTTPNP
jgi:glucan phosphoethanolaminetransferase (alkaline phosphatase superfamily)